MAEWEESQGSSLFPLFQRAFSDLTPKLSCLVVYRHEAFCFSFTRDETLLSAVRVMLLLGGENTLSFLPFCTQTFNHFCFSAFLLIEVLKGPWYSVHVVLKSFEREEG